jgi:predicted  nucleic acid-binding Zn-ribbon protein
MTNPIVAKTEVKIADFYELFEQWRRQQDRDRGTILDQVRRIEDLERQRNRAIDTIEQAFSLTLNRQGDLTFQQATDEIIRQLTYREGEDKAKIEALEAELTRLRVDVNNLKAENKGALDNLIWALEFPPHRARELANAVAAAIELIVDAKEIIRANP